MHTDYRLLQKVQENLAESQGAMNHPSIISGHKCPSVV
jgi:hypothetical protein